MGEEDESKATIDEEWEEAETAAYRIRMLTLFTFFYGVGGGIYGLVYGTKDNSIMTLGTSFAMIADAFTSLSVLYRWWPDSTTGRVGLDLQQTLVIKELTVACQAIIMVMGVFLFFDASVHLYEKDHAHTEEEVIEYQWVNFVLLTAAGFGKVFLNQKLHCKIVHMDAVSSLGAGALALGNIIATNFDRDPDKPRSWNVDPACGMVIGLAMFMAATLEMAMGSEACDVSQEACKPSRSDSYSEFPTETTPLVKKETTPAMKKE